MRSVRWLRCAAAVGCAAPLDSAEEQSKSASSGAPSVSGVSEAGSTADRAPPSPPPPPLNAKLLPKTGQPQKWRVLTFKSWQLQTVEDAEDRATMPTAVLYYGDHLGPRPLIILDHSVTRQKESNTMLEACEEASRKYEPLLSSLCWDYGVVYVPLPVSLGEEHVMEQSCRHVTAVLSAIDVQWSHILGYSYGALVAARMAASAAYPHRIGSLLLFDTPLVTEKLLRNTRQREEIAKAKKDFNVPAAELSFAIESLKSDVEAPLPCPARADTSLYEEHLFSPQSLFRDEGLIREEHRYIPVRHLAQIHHPLQLITPAQQPLADVAVHKEMFGLRRPAIIKTAECHDDIFSLKCAGEVADVVRSWMQRFEQDVVLKRRFEQAAKEMSQLMGSTTPTGKGESGAPKQPEKKEKKKKSKQLSS